MARSNMPTEVFVFIMVLILSRIVQKAVRRRKNRISIDITIRKRMVIGFSFNEWDEID